ncbi:MAG: metallophosphoesterase [Draconibacterium sp.]|nr:metallophosphoesterase [Draconibacterium sp.]
MYDIIGDVHGQVALLKKLLLKLGYEKSENGYFHVKRKAIFVGDFINRGSEIRKTIRLIRKMVKNGNAFAILGNHEINAMLLHLKDKSGKPLVKESRKNYLSLFKTINEFSNYPNEWKKHLQWMRRLPFFLELKGIRIVHACWSDSAVEVVKSALNEERSRKSIFREYYKNPKSELSKSINILTKGINLTMPGNLKVVNNKGVVPREFRLSWWENPDGKTFREMSFESKYKLPAYTVPKEIIPETFFYSENEPIIFFGHYCRANGPHIINTNLCCVDSCVSGAKLLTAYSWSGEKVLNKKNLHQTN